MTRVVVALWVALGGVSTAHAAPAAHVVRGGGQSCLVEKGKLVCWDDALVGATKDGRLRIEVLGAPRHLSIFGRVRTVATSGVHTCAIGPDRLVRCMGYGVGQFSEGTPVSSNTPGHAREPVVVERLSGATQVAVGTGSDACAVSKDGTLTCWSDPRRPTVEREIADAVQVDIGSAHTCVLRAGGEVLCRGDNRLGQLALNPADIPYSAQWRTIPDLPPARVLSVGAFHTCAVVEGVPWCWGLDVMRFQGGAVDLTRHERLPRLLPAPRDELSHVVEVAGGTDFTCARMQDGAVRCWGSGRYCQLGHEQRTTPAMGPVLVDDAVSLSASATAACAHREAGSTECWGWTGQRARRVRRDLVAGSECRWLVPRSH